MLSQTRSSAIGTGDGHYRVLQFWRRCIDFWHVRRPADVGVGGKVLPLWNFCRGTWRGSSARLSADD